MSREKHPEGGKLTMFVDCVSPYSWFGFTNAMRYRPLLQAHGISVDIVSFFLGAAREAAGNPFTPTPKWRQAFSAQDCAMTAEMLGLNLSTPEEFPILSLFAVRVVTWVKDHYSPEIFDRTFPAFSVAYWSAGINISKPEGVIKALKDIFSEAEIKEIMEKAVTPANKKRVVELTSSSSPAFGAPWIQAVNSSGERRDWFGNDRWEQVLYHLEVPFTPVQITPPKGAGATAKL
ncbi:hypothetical protein LTR12_012523 [Friedmanniomyces endolithicus]|nr:hypothetical protein LTR74_002393 [Friedmanniomyces endolithicus]KAK1813074.1 hypothetical protein LTR12_012523 [Friedmanniomyces endolithicus]